MNLTSPSEIKKIMESNNLRFNKGFGQNFLINDSVVERIADECVPGTDFGILEIGPGIGTLTKALCERFPKVVSVEIDRGLIPVLEQTVGDNDNLTVINEDILKLPLKQTVSEYFKDMPVCVCANLPYYITTPIIMALLESGVSFSMITVMIQKEVADRLASPPGSAGYGSITASVNRRGEVIKRFNVPAGCFMPAPKVDSTVISIIPHSIPAYSVKDENMLTKVINSAFAQRRKTLANSMASFFPEIDKSEIEELIVSAGFDKNIRGEKLGVKDFALLSDLLTERKAAQS